MLQTNLQGKSKTSIYIQQLSFCQSCHLWQKVEKCCAAGWPYITIWRVRIACWITKAINTHSECVPSIAFPLQKLLQGRASTLRLHVQWLACNVSGCHLKCYILVSKCQFWFCSEWSCTRYCTLSPWFGSSTSDCHNTSHHATSHHITSRHITSRHITLRHITSRHITSHHATTHYIKPHHITPRHITSRHIASHHITPHHITSHHINATSHHILQSLVFVAACTFEIDANYPPLVMDISFIY